MKRRLALAAVAVASLVMLASGAGAGGTRLRVALVTDLVTKPSQRSIRGLIYSGFLRGVRELGVQGRVVQINPKLDPADALESLAREKYDLIVTGLVFPEFVDAVAPRFPRSKFVMPDLPYEALRSKPRNVQGFDFRVEEGAYLAGYLAALMEKRRPGRDVISAVGGADLFPVNRFIAGYRVGAKRANPSITILRGYAQSFLDPAKCRAVARGQIAGRSGVVFPVAGVCGLGALEAAKEKGVWAIGVDGDLSHLGPHILTSVLKREDVAVYTAIEQLTRGALRTGANHVWNLRNGGVGLGRINANVPRSFIRELERIRAQIVAGRIKVSATLG